mgnify:CR=1 FL=1
MHMRDMSLENTSARSFVTVAESRHPVHFECARQYGEAALLHADFFITMINLKTTTIAAIVFVVYLAFFFLFSIPYYLIIRYAVNWKD